MKSSWKLIGDFLGNDLLPALLANRGVSVEESNEFIESPQPNLELAKRLLRFTEVDFKKISSLFTKAINDGRPIIIHGDYDVDGISATAILWKTIYNHLSYKNCYPFIPNRFDHGYGLSKQSIDEVSEVVKNHSRESGPLKSGLLVTVDCGITAFEEVEYAKSKGFEVLIVDHHAKPETRPSCSIFYSDRVCAAGLSYIISRVLNHDQTGFLELAALGTVADLQPLFGFNRSLTKSGLDELSSTKNVGLTALKKISGIEGKNIGTFEVGWILAPRLNAAGRLETALESLRLLCTESEDQALKIAEKLNHLNLERQELTKAAVDLALSVTQGKALSKVTVAVHEQFHEGIIGLVAGRLVSYLGTPAVVISKGAEFSKASARSVEGFNIVEFLRSLGSHFENIGGHAGAAGFTIRTERIEEFLRALNLYQKNLEIPLPTLKIEKELKLEEITYDLLELINKLAPFGLGNQEPLFLSRKVPVQNVTFVGNGKSHLKLNLGVNGKFYSAIFFGKGKLYKDLTAGDYLDIVYNLSENNWNGEKSISLKIRDIDTFSHTS